MSNIIQINTEVTGQAGINPRRVTIITKDDLLTVTTAGYLNTKNLLGNTIYPTDNVVMWYGYLNSANPGIFGYFTATVTSDGIITLNEWTNPGDVLLPVFTNNIPIFNNLNGQIKDSGVHFSNLSYSVVPTLQGISLNRVAVFSRGDGTLDAASATGGNILFPTLGQSTTYNLPDPGTGSVTFLVNTGPQNILNDYQTAVGIDNVFYTSGGTWSVTRAGAGDYVYSKSVAAETVTLGIDITPYIRTTASKGFKLDSIDVIYSIGTLALVAHSGVLYQVTYINNTPNTIVSIATTGSLATATQANVYVSNLAIASPAFLNTANSKYIFELTLQAAATSGYGFYGLNLHFSQTIA